jgi:eukaryotic-like serine/threonine-protein kinase
LEQPFTLRLVERGDATFATLAGDITERSDLSPLLSVSSARLVLDLSGVRRINSTGVRSWIRFMSTLSKRTGKIELERCSVVIVHHLNMISSFKGAASVRSVLAPYECPNCEESKLELIDLKAPSIDLKPELPCPRCGGVLEFDDIPDSYLGFREF